MTATIHFSGLNTDPAFLIHLASDSRHRACPQASLLPCWLDFGQVGLGYLRPHPLGNISQFHPITGNPEAPNLSRHDNAVVSGSFFLTYDVQYKRREDDESFFDIEYDAFWLLF